VRCLRRWLHEPLAALRYATSGIWSSLLLTGPNVILVLKIAVATVTVILLASLACLVRGNYRWHGRLNVVFFVLTLGAVLGLEAIVRFINPDIFDYFDESQRNRMTVHLCFSIPSTILLPLMLISGLTHRRTPHILLGVAFLIFWIGTFVTGIFFLSHSAPR
jgi:hypothetical protein